MLRCMIAVEYMTAEISNGEILEALQEFAGHVDEKFSHVDKQFSEIRSEIGGMKSQMVTKSYLDDKLADLKGDMTSMIRKEDQKMNRLVNVLAEKRVLSIPETKDVLSFKVFP
jgi:predicted  nucleic acid-binding Zn-ribbon protein